MFKGIIVAVDSSETGRPALDAALGMANLPRSWPRAGYVLADPAAWWDAPDYDLSVPRHPLLDEGAKLSEKASADVHQLPPRLHRRTSVRCRTAFSGACA